MAMKVHTVDPKALLLGDNEFESGMITVSAGSTIASGTLLQRGTGLEFAVAVSGTPVAVLAETVTNDGASDKQYGIRPCIAGKVRQDALNFNGAAVTVPQCDMLRNYGILAVKVADLSRLDNGAA